METLRSLLSENPLFRDLEPEFLDTLAGCASNASFEPDCAIFHEGEPADRFYVIREGRVALEAFQLEHGPVVLQTMDAGDVLGWSWLVPPHRWRFDARSVTRVRAFAFDGTCLRDKCNADPRLGYALLLRFANLLEQRLQAARLQTLDVYRSGR